MDGHNIIVIGASAGGLEPLIELVSHLPTDLPASLFVCLHVAPHSTSVLPGILTRKGTLPATHANNGDQIVPGQILIAPPDFHLLVKEKTVEVTHGPKENGHRPSIDALFRSAARSHGRRVVGVILSGTLDDGVAGLSLIKRIGGTALVQAPDEAHFPGMPNSAIEHVTVDAVLPVAEIAARLIALAYEPIAGNETQGNLSQDEIDEIEVAETDMEGKITLERPGVPSRYTCPECHGALWEIQEGSVIRFRCRTGHAFSSASLVSEQTDALEAALWTALRALEEKEDLSKRLSVRARGRRYSRAAAQFEEQADDAAKHAEVLRRLLQQTKRSDPLKFVPEGHL